MDYIVQNGNTDIKTDPNDFNFQKFVQNIRLLTYANHLNYNKLGKETGCLPNMFYRYEKGTRTPDTKTLIKLSDYFHVSINQLLGMNEYDEDIQRFVDLYAVLPQDDKDIVDAILKKYEVA